MLVMASYIIRADGRIMHSEMEYVRNFLRTNFGVAAVGEGERIIAQPLRATQANGHAESSHSEQTIRDCGRQIAANLTYEERLQLLGFLANKPGATTTSAAKR